MSGAAPGPPGGGAPADGGADGGWIPTAGLVLFAGVAAAFVVGREVPLLDGLFLSALLTLLPALAVAQVPLVARAELERSSAYAGSAVTVGVLGLLALALGRRRGGLAYLGLGPVDGAAFTWTTLGLLAAAGALTGLFWLAERRLGWKDSPILAELLPRTSTEKHRFAGLSVAAGLGEELAYRGYAVPALAPLLGGVWPSAVFTSVLFGVLHAYQGPAGMARTALLGLALAASLLLSGSLWPAIAAHVVIDLVGGLWLGERLLRR